MHREAYPGWLKEENLIRACTNIAHTTAIDIFCIVKLKSNLSLYLTVWLTNSEKLTGTFFWVITTAQSFPRTATDVRPPWLMALNAYSVENKINMLTMIINYS